MFDLDKWQEITAALKKNKLRTILTGLGVMFGILILVTLLGIGRGFQNNIQSSLGNFATNSTVFWVEKTTKAYKGLPRNRSYQFTNDDLEVLKRSIPELQDIAPDINGWSGNATNNTFREDKKGNFRIKGTSPEMNNVNPVEVTAGRFINQNDLKEFRKVITIGPRVQELMFEKDEDPIGQYLKVNGIYFRIIGTIKPLSRNMGMRDDVLQMPFTTLQQLYNQGDKFRVFLATAKVGESVADLEDKIFEILARRHSIHPDDRQAIGNFNIAKMFNKIFGLFNSIGFLFWVIGFGVLLTGIIGVSNIMHVVVKERTKELGIKRAIGARPREVVGQIINEAVFLTTFAGFWGLVLGVLIVEGIGKMTEGDPNPQILNPYVDINVAFIALGVLVLFGVLAGLLPAQRAIRIKPVDALRYE
ncbi:FtsX-like permease family protein [Labilibaculum sp. A4]|uniref:FtsX-like permease family protein n=1 Tax=Labilibaculum euxinus TaxID=2686357 RepID=A0A425Y9F6_9BACT|nr:ABC transporter permease [Labilibaculum euxinus]MDQ1770058.1 ABC transporter permease [Labilibaculum euxinus]MUP37729.1 FtsX-like permease family protein [Labilibaculum euxinus]MVB06934.1 FtsX-like permease family protein [Labilibaculum euxinus]MWN77479.1 FtsX-like permease family protein [Labilibaculum euxinus]